MENKQTLKINGKVETHPTGLTLRRLLESRGINPHVVACELNLKVIRRKDLDEVVLKEGDELEILQMIGGG